MNNSIQNKTIHYCWFGGNPLPKLAVSCIESWKRYFPGWEIKQWDETNYNVNKCDYIREAYEAKKWAFVSDYARFDILYTYGGVYFDTDVEVINSFESIIAAGAFMGLESISTVAPGLGLAANPGHRLYKEILDKYEKRHFIREDGSLDQMTVVTFTTEILKKHGFVINEESSSVIQNIDGIRIYPTDYFCPMDYMSGRVTISGNTRSIHHYSASWHTGADRIAANIQRKLSSHGRIGRKLGNEVSLPLIAIDRMLKVGIRNTMMRTVSYIQKTFSEKRGGYKEVGISCLRLYFDGGVA